MKQPKRLSKIGVSDSFCCQIQFTNYILVIFPACIFYKPKLSNFVLFQKDLTNEHIAQPSALYDLKNWPKEKTASAIEPENPMQWCFRSWEDKNFKIWQNRLCLLAQVTLISPMTGSITFVQILNRTFNTSPPLPRNTHIS